MLMSPVFRAPAQLSYASQARSISASMPGAGGGSASAPGFGPFNQSVSSSNFSTPASASQNSRLDPMLISAAGSAYEGVGSIFGNPISGSASSNFSASFIAPLSYSFSASGTFSASGCHITGPGLDVWLTSVNPSVTGVLLAGGTYTMQVSTSGGFDGGQPQVGSYNVQLAITGIVNEPVGTAFTYQGVVRKDGVVINSPSDFEFALFERSTGSNQIGPTVSVNSVPVINGSFTQALDFGSVFDKDEKWLEVRVRAPSGSGAFETVLPRTRLNPTPYAIFATNAANAERVGWEKVADVPDNVRNAFSPWLPIEGGIVYGGAKVVIPTDGLSAISFGNGGETATTAENTDYIGFRRVNVVTGAANQSELRLFLGDETSGSATDYFTIGTSPNGTWTPRFQFGSDGSARKPGGGSWASISDPRTKHDAKVLHGTLDRLLQLRGYEYLYNDIEIANGRALPGRQIGLMADEVERIFPDWVTRDHDGMRMVTERSTTALMVEALRDLRSEKDSQIAERDQRIEKLETENREMKARLDRLEKAIQEKR